MITDFAKMSSESKVWIFQSERNLTEFELKYIQKEIEHFIQNWESHGVPIKAAFEIFFQQIIVISVDETSHASGCSIDKQMHLFQRLSEKLGINLIDRNIPLVHNEKLMLLPLQTFREKVKKGEVDNKAHILNNNITTMAELGSKWKLPIAQSWAAKLLPTTVR